jgi:TRAP-type C4-dicarboxylate transport system substrate-binding protein
MHRRTALKILGASLAGSTLLGTSRGAGAAEVIKMGTLVPASSPWGQIFKVWADAISKKSGGGIELQFFYNGQQGDEPSMAGKLKAGQLDGGAFSGVGLGKLHRPILALQMPGLFTSWGKLDAARDAMKGDFEKGLSDAGIALLGWYDVGLERLLSKGVVIRTGDDIKGQKPFLWREDDNAVSLYQQIGGVTPVPLAIPEVAPQLNTGAINVVPGPAILAEQFKWSDKLDTIIDQPSSTVIGAIVISSKRLAALTEEQRNMLVETAKIAANALTKRIRSEDDASFARLQKKMKVTSLSADEKTKWEALQKATRQKLGQGVYPADLVAKLESFR